MDPLDELYRQEATTAQHIARLIAAYLRGTIQPADHDELEAWIASDDQHMRLFEELTDEKQQKLWMARVEGIDTEAALRRARGRVTFSTNRGPLRYFLWTAAATLLLVAGFWLLDRGKQPAVVAPLAVADSAVIVPGGNRATLTLADGNVIDLSSASTGMIFSGEGSHVNKPSDGELAYETGEPGEGPPPFHTLSTPLGGQFTVILPDGTKVWLNASSSLRYPVYFTGNSREVEVTGEAYFEVTKDASRPFRVRMPDSSEVEVLGTHFDLENYAGAKVTLLEGKVKVKSEKPGDGGPQREVILKPGEQAVVKTEDRREKIEVSQLDPNQLEEVMGWKDGLFVFHEATIQSILPQLERWYQIKVVDQTNQAPWHFTATIERKEPLDKVLNLLSSTGHIHFNIQNKTLYVLP